MSTPIVPTVGRKVWFYNSNQQQQPYDATVIATDFEGDKWAGTATAIVRLFVIDPNGLTRTVDVQLGDETTEDQHYRWMPYQVAQAQKDAS